jgi:pimeloyl-ACP methyl ester carboxylesterase
MLYASRHQSEIDRLVLVDITPGGRRPAAGPNVRPDTRPEARPEAETNPRDFESEEEAIRYLSRAMSRAPRALLEESVRHGLRKNDAGRYVWKYDPLLFTRRVPLPQGMDLWSLVATIETPTLLQWGSESDVVNAELAKRLGETMPRCTVECVEGAGHGLFTDRPDDFAAGVERFIKNTGGAA